MFYEILLSQQVKQSAALEIHLSSWQLPRQTFFL